MYFKMVVILMLSKPDPNNRRGFRYYIYFSSHLVIFSAFRNLLTSDVKYSGNSVDTTLRLNTLLPAVKW